MTTRDARCSRTIGCTIVGRVRYTRTIGISWRQKRCVHFKYPFDLFTTHRYLVGEASTIIQFRNMDHQMERCEIQDLVPLGDMPHDPAADIEYSGEMDVWLLDNSRELSRYVRQDRSPKRAKKSTNFQFRQNSEQSTIVESFHCPSPRFSTFEFVCSKETPNCKVDFWWVKKPPLNGKHTSNSPRVTL